MIQDRLTAGSCKFRKCNPVIGPRKGDSNEETVLTWAIARVLYAGLGGRQNVSDAEKNSQTYMEREVTVDYCEISFDGFDA